MQQADVRSDGQPFFEEGVAAGFPSPASGELHESLSLNELCVTHPATTYYVRARGESMIGAGIEDGDILVVDRSLIPANGDIIIAAIDGEFTVKRLVIDGAKVMLVAAHPAYKPRLLTPEERSELFGVVTWTVKPIRRTRTGAGVGK